MQSPAFIPIPPKRQAEKSEHRLKIEALGVGESVHIDLAPRQVSHLIYGWNRVGLRKFTMRRDEVFGVRIWRTA